MSVCVICVYVCVLEACTFMVIAPEGHCSDSVRDSWHSCEIGSMCWHPHCKKLTWSKCLNLVTRHQATVPTPLLTVSLGGNM